MSWLISNWVERRVARDQHLRNAAEVWTRAQKAIDQACDSLREHYADIATIERTRDNKYLVTIIITRPPTIPARKEEKPCTVISVEFEPEKPTITVKVDGAWMQEFAIQADSDHAFITVHGSELLFDEFSRLVLEAAFFARSQSRRPHRALTIIK